MDPLPIDPYQEYIDYLEYVVIYNLKRQLSEALASPNPSSSQTTVTEPPKIVPYYRLSLSTWPLSNNKELF
jgi:hypothetical protein